jgi:hypothetical protein
MTATNYYDYYDYDFKDFAKIYDNDLSIATAKTSIITFTTTGRLILRRWRRPQVF